MSEQPFERLAWQNRWIEHLVLPVSGADCFVPFVNINPSDNLLVMRLSEQQIVRMLSALQTGAIITYPDEWLQIMVDFLSSIHCPPLMAEQECYEYPTYASFMQYQPINPYIDPDTTPEGYLLPPFQVNSLNGVDDPELEPFDIIVPFGAFELGAGWFDLLDGIVPSITIMVNGAGHADIKMLTMPYGGLAVITLDNPPNLADIVIGIITGADNIMDLNLDQVSVPAESVREIIYPMDIVGSGLHTIYVTFLPIMDDSFVPLRFGGGFRGVQLCNFIETVIDMSITEIRIEGCEIEVFKNGVWEGLASGSLDACLTPIAAAAAAAQATADEAMTNAIGALDQAAAAQATADEALGWAQAADAAAAAAQETADGAVATNVNQTNSINDHEARIDALESSTAATEAELDAIVELLAYVGLWHHEFNFAAATQGFTASGGSWTSGQGWVASGGAMTISLASLEVPDSRVIEVGFLMYRPTGVVEVAVAAVCGGTVQQFRTPESSSSKWIYVKVDNLPTMQNFSLTVQAVDFGTWSIAAMSVVGVYEDIF